jgi:hypothetical protein
MSNALQTIGALLLWGFLAVLAACIPAVIAALFF